MPKVKIKEWMVPIRLTISATVFMKAATLGEAKNAAERGLWDAMDEGEALDWELAGEPEENL